MPNIISLDTGILNIDVEIDKNRTYTLSFNPHDVTFLERGHQIYKDALVRSAKLKQEQKDFVEPTLDENGMPIDIEKGTALIKETNEWFRTQIDLWLGDGTSQAIFGDAVFADEKMSLYSQLISGVMEFVTPQRSTKMAQFIAPQTRKSRKRG